MPEAGGTVQPLTTVQGTEFHGAPSYVPGGSAVVFHIGDFQSSEDTRLAVVPLAGGEVRELGIEGSVPKVTSDGTLLFLRDNVLWAAQFDATRLEITSETIPVLDDIHVLHFFHQHMAVFLPAEKRTNRSRNRPWVQRGRRYLIEKRLKQMVVVLVDDDDVCIGTTKRPRSRNAGETAAYYDDTWLGRIHRPSFVASLSTTQGFNQQRWLIPHFQIRNARPTKRLHRADNCPQNPILWPPIT